MSQDHPTLAAAARAGHDFGTPKATQATGAAPHLPNAPGLSSHHFPRSRWLSPPSSSNPCSSCSTPLPPATLAKRPSSAPQQPLPPSAMQAEVPSPASHLEVSSFLWAGEGSQSLWVSLLLDEKGLGSERPVFCGAGISIHGWPAAAGSGGGCRSNVVQTTMSKVSEVGSEAWCSWHPWVGRKSSFHLISLFRELLKCEMYLIGLSGEQRKISCEV